jgi:hypothetical protein
MREKILLIGYCGVNCKLCPSYQSKTCYGCRSLDKSQKRTSKWNCRIRNCCLEKNLKGCGECPDFYSPRNLSCHKRRRLVRRYKEKYNIDLNKNAKSFIKMGEKWIDIQKQKYTCTKCGGLINPYTNSCYTCDD